MLYSVLLLDDDNYRETQVISVHVQYYLCMP